MSTHKLQHLGIIMDGNRRWARERDLPTLIGHKKGYDKVLKVADWCYKRNIKELTLFAFSTENWFRSKKEVSYLMSLFKQALLNDVDKYHKKGYQLRILGRKNKLDKEILKLIGKAESRTKDNNKLIVNLAINYGGQYEISDAVNKIIKSKIKSVTPKTFSNYFYIPNMLPADLIVRTAGEMRLSGFLLYHSAYSELMFLKTCWPSISEKDIKSIINEYNRRHRTYGGK